MTCPLTLTRPWVVPRPNIHLLPRQVFRHHKGAVTCMDTDPAGRFLYTGSHDYTVIVWNILSGRRLKVRGVRRWPLAAFRSFVCEFSFLCFVFILYLHFHCLVFRICAFIVLYSVSIFHSALIFCVFISYFNLPFFSQYISATKRRSMRADSISCSPPFLESLFLYHNIL